MGKKKEKLKQDKARLSRLSENSISVESFLARVLGIRDKSLLSSRISHSDLKQMFPQLVRPSFNYVVDNPAIIFNGEAFLVEDSFGSVVPYFNPSFLYEETEYFGEFTEERPREEIPNIDDLELSELSNYELQNLLHIYSAHNIRSAHRKVHDELISRKDSRHASHESRERSLRKTRKNERHDTMEY